LELYDACWMPDVALDADCLESMAWTTGGLGGARFAGSRSSARMRANDDSDGLACCLHAVRTGMDDAN
jgi:hypothetical protein